MTSEDAAAGSSGQRPLPAAVPAGPRLPAAVPAGPRLAAEPGRTARDMALSLLVLLVPVMLVVLAYRVLHHGDEPVVIDPGPAIAQARASAAFPIAAPDGLGADWRPVSAVFRTAGDGATLRLGYLSPSGAGLQVVQSSVPTGRLLATELGDRPETRGTQTVAGRQWQWYAARRGETALVLTEPARTIVVIGDAPLGEVRALAAAMR